MAVRRAIQTNYRFEPHKQVIETTSFYNRSLRMISIVGLNDE